jgi:iron complex transport system permease protein
MNMANNFFRHGSIVWTAILLPIIPLIVLLSISIGSVSVPLEKSIAVLMGLGGQDVSTIIINAIRLPRVLAALAGGAALGISGAILQVFFRNPIADPYVIGVSSGSALFIAFAVFMGTSLGIGNPFSPYTLYLAGFIGALMVSLFMIFASGFVRGVTTLLIIGVAISYLASALTSILQAISDIERLHVFIFWVMGSFSGAKWVFVNFLIIALIAGLVFSLLLAKPLNAFMLSENYAQSMGINIRVVKVGTIALASFLTSVVTVVAGPVGFIGLVAPHISRYLSSSSDNRVVLPLSAIVGSIITAIADLAARTLMMPRDLPITAITAIFGAPLVIILLLKGGAT